MKMTQIKKMAKDFIRDESGQSTTEYVLLLVVVVFIVKQLKGTMSERLKNLVGKAFDTAETSIGE